MKNDLQTSYLNYTIDMFYIYIRILLLAMLMDMLLAIKFIKKNENEKYITLIDSLSYLISVENKFNLSDIANTNP